MALGDSELQLFVIGSMSL